MFERPAMRSGYTATVATPIFGPLTRMRACVRARVHEGCVFKCSQCSSVARRPGMRSITGYTPRLHSAQTTSTSVASGRDAR